MLKEQIEFVKNAARSNFLTSGSLVPVFIAEVDGEKTIMPLFWKGPEDKEAFSNQLKQWISDGDVTEYIMVNEAWILKEGPDSSSVREWLQAHGSLENHPDRTEGVMIQYCSPTEEICYFADIIRNDDNSELGEWHTDSRKLKDINPFNISSRFNGLFSKSSAELN